MSFLKIDPVKRERVVKEFLEIKKNIRANELAEKTGKIELREDLSEFFKPVTDTQKATSFMIQKGLKPIEEAIEQLPRGPRQQIGYPLSAPPSYRSSSPTESELEETEEAGESLFLRDSDTTFGVYKKGNDFFWGDKQFKMDKKNLYIGKYKFNNTPGLLHLITSKSPTPQLFKDEDLDPYNFILTYTNTIHQGNNPKNPYPKASRSQKWKNFIKPVWDSLKTKTGSGLKKVVIPGDPNALLEKLNLLMASKAAGNTGLRNELVSVCNELKRQGILDNKRYKKIMSLL